MLVEEGDKLLCKKKSTFIYFGQYYYVVFAGKLPYNQEFYYLSSNINCYENDEVYVFQNNDKHGQYIWDYFYTEIEMRKMKLRKIDNENF